MFLGSTSLPYSSTRALASFPLSKYPKSSDFANTTSPDISRSGEGGAHTCGIDRNETQRYRSASAWQVIEEPRARLRRTAVNSGGSCTPCNARDRAGFPHQRRHHDGGHPQREGDSSRDAECCFCRYRSPRVV